MTETITITDPVTVANPGISKGGRTGPVTLTDRMCEKRVDPRTKFSDRKCPGLYVSINVDGVATFSPRYTDRFTGKRRAFGSASTSPDNSPSIMPARRLIPEGPHRHGRERCRDVAPTEDTEGQAGHDGR